MAAIGFLIHGMNAGSDLEIDSALVIIALVAGAEMVEYDSATQHFSARKIRSK
jgi:hypothetical protein